MAQRIAGAPVKRSDVPDALVLAVIQAIATGLHRGKNPYEILVARGIPPKVVLRKLEHMADRDLIDYGTWIGHPFLTDLGLATLATKALEVASKQTAGGQQ